MVVVVVVVVVVAQRWDAARPQDVLNPTLGMVQAQACVIKLRVLADQPGIPIAGNVISGTQSPRQGEQSDGEKPAMQGRDLEQDHCGASNRRALRGLRRRDSVRNFIVHSGA